MDGSGVILRDGALVDNSENRRNEDNSEFLADSENSNQSSQDYLDIKQNERGIRVTIDRRNDNFLTAFGKATLTDRYLMRDEDFQDLFARVAMHYADDSDHAQRIGFKAGVQRLPTPYGDIKTGINNIGKLIGGMQLHLNIGVLL